MEIQKVGQQTPHLPWPSTRFIDNFQLIKGWWKISPPYFNFRIQRDRSYTFALSKKYKEQTGFSEEHIGYLLTDMANNFINAVISVFTRYRIFVVWLSCFRYGQEKKSSKLSLDGKQKNNKINNKIKTKKGR